MPDPTPAQRLGRRIWAERSRRHWSIKKTGQAAGISYSVVWGVENGREIEFSNAARIAAVLGIPLDEPGALPAVAADGNAVMVGGWRLDPDQQEAFAQSYVAACWRAAQDGDGRSGGGRSPAPAVEVRDGASGGGRRRG